jgi:hypothetical protein
LVLEVEISKVAGWAVSARAWGSETGVAAPLAALLGRAKVLGERRVKVRADLRAVCDVSLFIVGSRARIFKVFLPETAASVYSGCTRVTVKKTWTINKHESNVTATYVI